MVYNIEPEKPLVEGEIDGRKGLWSKFYLPERRWSVWLWYNLGNPLSKQGFCHHHFIRVSRNITHMQTMSTNGLDISKLATRMWCKLTWILALYRNLLMPEDWKNNWNWCHNTQLKLPVEISDLIAMIFWNLLNLNEGSPFHYQLSWFSLKLNLKHAVEAMESCSCCTVALKTRKGLDAPQWEHLHVDSTP